MNIAVFAGPVISNTTWYSLLFGAFLIVVIIVAAVMFGGAKIFKSKMHNTKSLTPIKAFILSAIVISTVALLIFVVPTVIEDNQQNNKQQKCAESAGYNSPDENESSKATSTSQNIYRACLDAD